MSETLSLAQIVLGVLVIGGPCALLGTLLARWDIRRDCDHAWELGPKPGRPIRCCRCRKRLTPWPRFEIDRAKTTLAIWRAERRAG